MKRILYFLFEKNPPVTPPQKTINSELLLARTAVDRTAVLLKIWDKMMPTWSLGDLFPRLQIAYLSVQNGYNIIYYKNVGDSMEGYPGLAITLINNCRNHNNLRTTTCYASHDRISAMTFMIIVIKYSALY